MPSQPELLAIRNGTPLSAAEAAIPLSDRAIACGAGVFETIASHRGRLLDFPLHIDRLRHGCFLLGIAPPETGALEEAAHHLVQANGLADHDPARIRLTVTAGPSGESPAWFVEATPAPPRAEVADLVVFPHRRNEHGALTGVKSISYGENLAAEVYAKQFEATEAIFGNTAGKLCEATWANLFLLLDGAWSTPTISSGCLPGITRLAILGLARGEIAETDHSLNVLDRVEAAFLTSSVRGIQPVRSLEGRLLDPGHPDIARWREAYHAYANS